MRPAALILLSLTALAGCSTESGWEPVGPQLPAVVAADPPDSACLASMSDERADLLIVSDIPKGKASGWRRWTGPRPTVRCRLSEGGHWLAQFDFVVAGITLKDTGPISLTFTVNDREVGRLRCSEPGRYHFQAPVPDSLVQAGAELRLTAVIDKPWTAPEDGSRLGVMVEAAGFVRP